MSKERETFNALYEVHKDDPSVLISNGFLTRVIDNPDLLGKLNKNEQAFLDLSNETFERDTLLAIAANEEGSTALIEVEQKVAELEQVTNTLYKEKAALVAAQAEGEELREALELSVDDLEEAKKKAQGERDAIAAELEQQAQYKMQSDRMRWQFKTAQSHSYPTWAMLFVMVIGIFTLYYFEKPGVDVLVPVFAGVIGAMYQAMSGAMASLFAPIVREEQKPRNDKGQIDD